MSGKEEGNSAIDSECEENDVIAKQIDDTGQLVSDSEKNDEHPTADVIDGTQCSSAQRESLVNVTVDGSGNNIKESGHSEEGRKTEPVAILDNSENTPHYNNSSVQRSSVPTRSPLAEFLVYPTPTQKTSKNRSCSRVLTSSESIAMLEERHVNKGRSKRKKNKREKIESSKKLLKRNKRDKKCRKDKLSKPRSRKKKGLVDRKETVHQMAPKVSGEE